MTEAGLKGCNGRFHLRHDIIKTLAENAHSISVVECDRFGTDTRLTHQLTERGSLDCIESAAVTTQNYPVVSQTSSVILWALEG